MYQEKRDTSEFNDALGYLYRINTFLSAAGDSKVNLDVFRWFHSLIGLFAELSTYMKEKELETFKKFIKDISREVQDQMNTNIKQKRNSINEKLYFQMLDFELNLRKVYKESGLQTKMVEESEKWLK